MDPQLLLRKTYTPRLDQPNTNSTLLNHRNVYQRAPKKINVFSFIITLKNWTSDSRELCYSSDSQGNIESHQRYVSEIKTKLSSRVNRSIAIIRYFELILRSYLSDRLQTPFRFQFIHSVTFRFTVRGSFRNRSFTTTSPYSHSKYGVTWNCEYIQN